MQFLAGLIVAGTGAAEAMPCKLEAANMYYGSALDGTVMAPQSPNEIL